MCKLDFSRWCNVCCSSLGGNGQKKYLLLWRTHGRTFQCWMRCLLQQNRKQKRVIFLRFLQSFSCSIPFNLVAYYSWLMVNKSQILIFYMLNINRLRIYDDMYTPTKKNRFRPHQKMLYMRHCKNISNYSGKQSDAKPCRFVCVWRINLFKRQTVPYRRRREVRAVDQLTINHVAECNYLKRLWCSPFAPVVCLECNHFNCDPIWMNLWHADGDFFCNFVLTIS